MHRGKGSADVSPKSMHRERESANSLKFVHKGKGMRRLPQVHTQGKGMRKLPQVPTQRKRMHRLPQVSIHTGEGDAHLRRLPQVPVRGRGNAGGVEGDAQTPPSTCTGKGKGRPPIIKTICNVRN